MKKLIILSVAAALLCSCTAQRPVEVTELPTQLEQTAAPTPENTYTEAASSNSSRSGEMTKLKETDAFLLSDDEADTLSLYTSVQKDDDGKTDFDDSNEFLLELCSGKKYYTLFDGRISNGQVYFDIVEYDEKPYILTKVVSTAGDYTEVFCIKDNSVFKTDELDLNDLKDKNTNLIYTSTPEYR